MGVILTFFKILLVLLLCIPVAYVAVLIVSRLTSDVSKRQKAEKADRQRKKGVW